MASDLPLDRFPWLLGAVWLGGAAGTGTRYLVSSALPHVDRVPVAIMGINIVGAFLLGALLDTLAHRGPDVGRRRLQRLLIGTGFLGGFTTYSALAVDTTELLRAGLTGHAVAYALLTLVVGGLATLAGIALGELLHRRQSGTTGGLP